MIPRNDFNFDDEIWFEHKHCGKEDERNFQSHVVVSTVQKLESKPFI